MFPNLMGPDGFGAFSWLRSRQGSEGSVGCRVENGLERDEDGDGETVRKLS